MTTARESTTLPSWFSCWTWVQLTGAPSTSQVSLLVPFSRSSAPRLPAGPATTGRSRTVVDSATPTIVGSVDSS